MTPVYQFHAHLSGCDVCEPTNGLLMCDYGRELLFEAGEDLDEGWQDVARQIHRTESLKRDADAFYAFYAEEGQ